MNLQEYFEDDSHPGQGFEEKSFTYHSAIVMQMKNWHRCTQEKEKMKERKREDWGWGERREEKLT